MIISQGYVLNQLKSHPDGCTIPELIDMKFFPHNDLSTVKQNYREKLTKLLRQGYVTREGSGTTKNPYIWRAVE